MNTEILEGNKTIAEFMGYANPHDNTGVLLKYHSSWDWLMPVKDKIDSIDNHEYDVIIWRSDCHINNRIELLFESSILKGNKTLIETVWGCIVEFIKWYNLNQPTH